jgi:pyridinium-3,5-bisthiocarboxylic acid mononucleotide nickel chelatase
VTWIHIDPFSGVSGDMLLGGFVDAGVSVDDLSAGLRSLDVDGWTLQRSERTDPRIGGTKVDVVLHDPPAGHPHRHLGDIERIVGASDLPEPVQARVLSAFRRLAEAEAEVHGTTPENVHFHEVGAVDAIVDVCGVLLAAHLLGVEGVSCTAVPQGSGFVDCAHGRIPVPVPATTLLLRGVPTVAAEGPHPTGELVTPTGATLLRTLVDRWGPRPPMTVDAVAYGLGGRDRGSIPNAVRLFVGRLDASEAQAVDVVTATIDDLDPRVYGPLIDDLLAAGALDATLTTVHGKKGRPAVQVTVLSPPDAAARDVLVALLFRHTTTLGLRWRREQRATLRRSFRRVSTPFGELDVKEGFLGDERLTVQPEFEQALALARSAGVPVRRVLDAARTAIE